MIDWLARRRIAGVSRALRGSLCADQLRANECATLTKQRGTRYSSLNYVKASVTR